MKSIIISFDLKRGNEFEIRIHEDNKRAKRIIIDRRGAQEIAQGLLEGLKETKKVYNKPITNP